MKIRQILVKLVAKAYKKGYEDSAHKCEADYAVFEKLVDEAIGK